MNLPSNKVYHLRFLNLDDIPKFFRGGYSFLSIFIENISRADEKELRRYLRDMNWNAKVCYFGNCLYIQVPCALDKAPNHLIATESLGDFNRAVSGRGSVPLYGVASQRDYFVNGTHYYDANYSVRAKGDRQVPNLIVETCFRDRQSNYQQFCSLLRSYMSDLPEVMVAMGFIILEECVPGELPLVCIVFHRGYMSDGKAHRLISFGTAPVHESARNVIEMVAGIHMVGVGISPQSISHLDASTAEDPEYLVDIEPTFMLRMDNDGNQLVGPLADKPFHIRLYDIQVLVAGKYAAFTCPPL